MTCLVYLDASPRGEWALTMARALPARLADPLTLLATTEDLAAAPGLLETAHTRLAAGGRRVRSVSAAGPAERAIVEAASSESYGLVVVPPAGRRALARMLRGSRVATVVRRVRGSVLVARRPPEALRRVLAAVSGGALTRPVIQAALAVAGPLGAQLAFVHVVPEVTLPFHHAAPPPEARSPVDAVTTIRGLLRESGLPDTLLVREGLVVEEVIDQAEQGACDLLVVGAPAAAGRDGWPVEDVTERILLQSGNSILVVRAPE